jgi:hypothetical protein
MACSKWEETGLLYTSDELTTQEKESFTLHLVECGECRNEYETYRCEQATLFSNDVLGATPSAACDAEILRVCSDGRKRITSVGGVSVFLKRSVISLALFVASFTVVGYLAFNAHESGLHGAGDGIVKSNTDQTIKHNEVGIAPQVRQNDSLADSTGKNSVNFANQRGNLDLNGVFPVDLQNK